MESGEQIAPTQIRQRIIHTLTTQKGPIAIATGPSGAD
jgi:hypothetical protein